MTSSSSPRRHRCYRPPLSWPSTPSTVRPWTQRSCAGRTASRWGCVHVIQMKSLFVFTVCWMKTHQSDALMRAVCSVSDSDGGSVPLRGCAHRLLQTWGHGSTGTSVHPHMKREEHFDEIQWAHSAVRVRLCMHCGCFQVCGHVCRCYSVAAQFEECREKIVELPNIIRDVCHILYYGKVRTHNHLLHTHVTPVHCQSWKRKTMYDKGCTRFCAPTWTVVNAQLPM